VRTTATAHPPSPAAGGRLRSRLLGRSSVVLAGNAGYALAQFGVLVVLARETSAAEVGRYALALAVTAPIQIGLGLRLRTVRAVDRSRTPFRTYWRLALVLAAAAVAAGAVAGLVTGRSEADLVMVVVLVALAKAVESLIDLCYGEYQRQDRLGTIAASQLARAALTIAFVVVGARLGGLSGALVAMLLGWTVQLVVLDGRRVRHSAATDADLLPAVPVRALIRHSWPLGLAGAVSSLSVALPRFLVAGLLDTATLGLFAVLSYPTTVVSLFANSVGQAQVRGMATAAARGERDRLRSTFLGTVLATLALGLVAAALVAVLGAAGVGWLLGPEYATELPLLLLLVLVATVSGLATNAYYLLVASGHFALQPVIVVATLVLATPAIYLATRGHGLSGTALALTGMYALQAVLTVAAALHHLGRDVLEPSEETTEVVP
jgi:O-antigen/teichoic acid export membrane protein